MDEIFKKQLIRQLKLLNFWITFFGVLFLVAMAIVGVLLYKVIVFTKHASEQVTNLQQKTSQALDVEQQLCDSRVSSYLKGDTCK